MSFEHTNAYKIGLTRNIVQRLNTIDSTAITQTHVECLLPQDIEDSLKTILRRYVRKRKKLMVDKEEDTDTEIYYLPTIIHLQLYTLFAFLNAIQENSTFDEHLIARLGTGMHNELILDFLLLNMYPQKYTLLTLGVSPETAFHNSNIPYMKTITSIEGLKEWNNNPTKELPVLYAWFLPHFFGLLEQDKIEEAKEAHKLHIEFSQICNNFHKEQALNRVHLNLKYYSGYNGAWRNLLYTHFPEISQRD